MILNLDLVELHLDDVFEILLVIGSEIYQKNHLKLNSKRIFKEENELKKSQHFRFGDSKISSHFPERATTTICAPALAQV